MYYCSVTEEYNKNVLYSAVSYYRYQRDTPVGCSLGCSEGCSDGCSLGCSEGCSVGWSLGCSVGASVSRNFPTGSVGVAVGH